MLKGEAKMNFINDQHSSFDYLGYEAYVNAFKYIIDNCDNLMNLPVVFGIHGRWGEGKSTFMELMQQCICNPEKYIIVNINPWEYNNSKEDFVKMFLISLFEAVKEYLDNEEAGREDYVKLFLKSILSPLKLSAEFKGIKAEYDVSKFTIESQKELIDEYVTNNFKVKKSIEKLLNSELLGNRKIIIFIDDLDRCSWDVVVNVLESIKLVLNSPNCIFFLGCDKEYLENALLVKYDKFISYLSKDEITNEAIGRIQRKFSKDYLEKIIQVPFNLPELDKNAYIQYIDAIFNACNPMSSINDIQSQNNLYEKFKSLLNTDLLAELFRECNSNPRRVKRILNLVFLNYLFLCFKNKPENIKDQDMNLLVFLYIVRNEFPDHFEEKLMNDRILSLTFKQAFENINKNEVDDDKINKLYKVFFNKSNIKTVKGITDLLKNIKVILTISNTTDSTINDENYWGKIGEIKSNTGTNRKLKHFLNRISNNEAILSFVLWFFSEIYDSEIYYLGIQINIMLYRKSMNKNHKEDFICKFEYSESDENLLLKFESGSFESCLSTKVFENKSIYDSSAKLISISDETNIEELEDIKKQLREFLFEGDNINE